MNIQPGTRNDPLVCRLEIVDLDSEHVEYPAVSYVWGNADDKKPIQCMNETLMIPSSLFSFLLIVRDEERDCLVWADAVCINQAETPEALHEREQQVEMMGTIFSDAIFVYVYLGEAPDTYKQLLTAAAALDEFGPDNINPQMFDRPDFPMELANLGLDSPIWETFDDILSRPWYQRVWTVQEFVLAQDITMCVGDYALPFEAFRAMCTLLEWFYLHLVSTARPDTPDRAIKGADLQQRCREARMFLNDCRDRYQEGEKIPLVDFLHVALQQDTTYARDRLYGGYGILDRDIVQRLPVDLELSTIVLSQRLSSQLLESGEGNFLLEHCAGPNPKSPMLHALPSWCIDLNGKKANTKDNGSSTMALSRKYEIYSAGGPKSQPVSITTTADPRVLVSDGYIVETIKSLTRPYPYLPHAPGAADPLQWLVAADWIETTLAWLGRVFQIPFPGSGGTWADLPNETAWQRPLNMLWRTLISDLVHAPSQFGMMDKYVLDENERPSEPKRPGVEFAAYFHAWLKAFRLLQQCHRSGRDVDTSSKWYQDIEAPCNEWMPQMTSTTGKRVGITHNGRLALLPEEAEIGDEICVFDGVKVPFVVRSSTVDGHYKLVGSCYLHEMMDGQVEKREDCHKSRILLE